MGFVRAPEKRADGKWYFEIVNYPEDRSVEDHGPMDSEIEALKLALACASDRMYTAEGELDHLERKINKLWEALLNEPE